MGIPVFLPEMKSQTIHSIWFVIVRNTHLILECNFIDQCEKCIRNDQMIMTI